MRRNIVAAPMPELVAGRGTAELPRRRRAALERAVDGLDHADVGYAFGTVGKRIAAFLDRVGEFEQQRRELIAVAEAALDGLAAARFLDDQALLADHLESLLEL